MNRKMVSEKGFNILLYVAAALPEKRNLYKVLKAIYVADMAHLAKYGRQLFPQDYQKLESGNVPASSYDVATHVRDGKKQNNMPDNVKRRIKVDKADNVHPLVAPDLGFISKSERDCLDSAIEQLRPLTFAQLRKLMHEEPGYKNDVKVNSYLSLEKHLIPKLENGKAILEYLKDPHPG